jgi:hypothetical protein
VSAGAVLMVAATICILYQKLPLMHNPNPDEVVKNQKFAFYVIPAKAGIF